MYWTLGLPPGEDVPQEQSGPENRFSISSSWRPCVSGRQPRTKIRPRATRPVYMKKAPGGQSHGSTVSHVEYVFMYGWMEDQHLIKHWGEKE